MKTENLLWGKKNPKSTNRHLGIPKAITRGEDTEKEKYFSFPGNKVTFLKNKPTNQPYYFLSTRFPTTGEFLLRTPGTHVTTSPLPQETEYIRTEMFFF